MPDAIAIIFFKTDAYSVPQISSEMLVLI